MTTIILVILLCASLFWNMKQHAAIKKCGCESDSKKLKRKIKKGTSTNITSEDPSDNQNGEDV